MQADDLLIHSALDSSVTTVEHFLEKRYRVCESMNTSVFDMFYTSKPI